MGVQIIRNISIFWGVQIFHDRCLVWSAKNYFGHSGAPCLERRLRIRAQLAPFFNAGTREVCTATLTTDELEFVIPGYREYQRVWSPDINERLNNS